MTQSVTETALICSTKPFSLSMLVILMSHFLLLKLSTQSHSFLKHSYFYTVSLLMWPASISKRDKYKETQTVLLSHSCSDCLTFMLKLSLKHHHHFLTVHQPAHTGSEPCYSPIFCKLKLKSGVERKSESPVSERAHRCAFVVLLNQTCIAGTLQISLYFISNLIRNRITGQTSSMCVFGALLSGHQGRWIIGSSLLQMPYASRFHQSGLRSSDVFTRP